jgi:GNAT superfamily N-acetyltransferase
MKIRKAGLGDVEAIMAIGQKTWPPTYAFAGEEFIAHGLATWWSAEATERTLADTTVLVAEDGDDVVGVGNLDRRGPVPIIWKLYVVPEAQGTGAGSTLLAALVAEAAGEPVRLEYTDGNERAARFYASHGFVEVRREPGEQPGWPDLVWVERAL